MRIPALVRNLDADLRLSRATGTIQVLATHRLADFEAVGPTGSEEAAIARNLIGSCDTRICLAQDTAPLAATREAIGLTEPRPTNGCGPRSWAHAINSHSLGSRLLAVASTCSWQSCFSPGCTKHSGRSKLLQRSWSSP
jgi:hypothetical protein